MRSGQRWKFLFRKIILTTLSLMSCSAFSQGLSFEHFGVAKGLSSNAVLSITQDAMGFIWFGTALGLNRYDGHRFKIYKATNDTSSVSNNNINSLITTGENLWIGTSAGLNLYHPGTDNFTRISLPGSNPVQANTIYALYQDPDKGFWVGTGNGLYQLANQGTNHFIRYFSPDSIVNAGKAVRSIFMDRFSDLWIGTNDGLVKISNRNGQPRYRIFKHLAEDPSTISANFIMSIASDNSGRIWVGTQGGGINIFEPVTQKFRVLKSVDSNPSVNKNIRSLVKDANGTLWAGTQEGLYMIDPDLEKISLYAHEAGNIKSLSQNSVYSIFEDDTKSLWVGTYFGGINASFAVSTAFNIIQNDGRQNSVSNNVISSMVEDEPGKIFIGTEGGGLNFMTNGKFVSYLSRPGDSSTLGSNLVKVVYKDRDGNIWTGTHGGGLNLFDKATKKFKRFLFKENNDQSLNSEVVSLLEDSSGRFWVGTNYGIKLFRRNGTQLASWPGSDLPPVLKDNFARAFLQDSRKRIWIGTTYGLFLYENEKATVISKDYINSLHEDAQGTIWAGCNNAGLFKYNPFSKQSQYFSVAQGMPSNNVVGILEDEKKILWLSTGNGLVKFDPRNSALRVYTMSDGIADNAFNNNAFMRSREGRLFFGGYNGITGFIPSAIEVNNYPAKLLLTGLQLFNQPVPIDGRTLTQDISTVNEINLQYGQDVVTIEFALLNYIRSDQNRYAYQLEGFDKTWNETANAEATYTNLPPGRYRFLVKGANSDGVWSKPVMLSVHVHPPLWRTWWAYTLYALLFVSFILLLTRYLYLKALIKKEDELHQVKLNFFTNISHEIRTHLTLIMVPLQKLMDSRDLTSHTRRQITQAKHNADGLLKLVSELMDFRKAETENMELHIAHHDIVIFLEEIFNSFRELAEAKQIKISFSHGEIGLPAFFDASQMEKVFFNLLTNAFKFTPEGGHISMRVDLREKEFIVLVKDNGRGISIENLDKIFDNYFQVADQGKQNTGYGIGLALAKRIVEQHRGTISVNSVPVSVDRAGNTCFTVIIPAGNKGFENSSVSESLDNSQQTDSGEFIKNNNTTILLIDDNPELRTLMHESFAQLYQVLQSEDGESGWKMAIEQLPDLIVSDVMMPGMDGFELCAKLKTDERTSHIPVILLTAKSMESDQLNGLKHGADIYLTKPFNTKTLELSVRNLLNLKEKVRLQFSRQIANEFTSSHVAAEQPVLENISNEFIQKVILLVDENMDNPDFGVEMLAKKVAMSQPVLYKKLKAVTNMSVNDFVKTLRLNKASQLLKSKQFTVYEVAYAVGFADRKYFSREFKKQFGKTPSEYAGS